MIDDSVDYFIVASHFSDHLQEVVYCLFKCFLFILQCIVILFTTTRIKSVSLGRTVGCVYSHVGG